MPSIPQSQFTPGAPAEAGTFNTVINQIITAFDSHTHDPNDVTNGFGGSINSSSGAIPANTSEPVQYPSSGTGLGSYISIVTTQGVEVEISRIRGQLARFTGGNWYDNVGSLLHYDPGTNNISSTGVVTGTSFNSTNVTGTAPLTVLSTTKVANLNVDMLNGAHGVAASGTNSPSAFVNSVAIHDGNGFLPQTLIYYDSAEAATNDSLVPNTSSIITNLNRIRYMQQQTNIAAGGTGWTTPPSSLVTSLNIFNNPIRSGNLSLYSGNGIVISEQSTGVFRIDATGTALASPGGLTYADIFGDSVISGLQTTNAGGLSVSVAPGTAYVAGTRQQVIYSQTLSVIANATNYVYWDGGQASTNFHVNTTGAKPAGTILIAQVITLSGSISSIIDKRTIGGIFNGHILFSASTIPPPTIIGTNIVSVTATNDSNDSRGNISFTTGTGTTPAGVQISITFANPYATTPYISCDPVGSNAVSFNAANKSATGFSLSSTTALTASTTYSIDYIILG